MRREASALKEIATDHRRGKIASEVSKQSGGKNLSVIITPATGHLSQKV